VKVVDVRPPDAAAVRRRAVVVPGNYLCAEHYVPLARKLAARGFHSRVLTLSGYHGEPPHARIGWDAQAEDVARVAAEHLGADGGTLVGHSMGGLIAFLAAARRPEGLRRLVLLEPLIIPWRRAAVRAARRYVKTELAQPADHFRNWTGSFRRVADPDAYPEWALRLHAEVRRTSHPMTVSALFHQIEQIYPLPWASVQVPTLILRGAASGWRARLFVRSVARRFMRARVAVVAGAGHWMINEADEAVADLIAGFDVD